ncbi:MAG: phosphoglucosamine mutase [Vicinamibacterales bacterium]
MPERLFGTDGVRGKAGLPPLDRETIRRLGAALVRSLSGNGGSPPHLLIGRDTRESGSWIERELAFGAASAGARVTSAGVVPTPAVAFLTRRLDVDAGIVISASHNPFEDNGIKVFSHRGEKFTEELETGVERILADRSWEVPPGEAEAVRAVDLSAPYLAHVRSVLTDGARLGRLAVGVDCANGATSRLAPRLMHELGFEVTSIGCEPDGRNINLDCGSTHPEKLSALVVAKGLRLGVAFDGDGDRAIFVDERGAIVNGDHVMLTAARYLQSVGRLRGNAVVATVMSNIGLEIALRESGIGLVRAPVGDKYVMEEMIRRNLALGGEQSGHVIFADLLFTGDGLITAMQVLQVMAATGRNLSDLASELRTYPQVLVNVRVARKQALESLPGVTAAIGRVEGRLAGEGRLLVRYSGTEPLLRIMIEGRDQQQISSWAEEIADEVRAEIGAGYGPGAE